MILIVFALSVLVALPTATSNSSTAVGSDKPAKSELSIADTTAQTPRPISSQDLLMLRDIDTLTVSPDGNYVAFQLRQAVPETNRYRTAWFVVSVARPGQAVNIGDAGEPQLLTFADGSTAGEVSPKPAQWSPDSEWIAYIVKKNGSLQLWRSRRDGSKEEQLTHNAADVRGFAWMDDGRKLYFIANQQTREQMQAEQTKESEEGYLLDARFFPARRQSKPYYKRTGDVPTKRGIRWLEDPEFGSDAELWIYDIGTQVERKSTEAEYDSYVRLKQSPKFEYKRSVDRMQVPGEPLVAFAPNNELVAWLDIAQVDDKSAWPDLRLFEANVHQARRRIECEDRACTGRIDGIWWSEDSKIIYFDRGEGINRSSHGLYAWSIENDTVSKILFTNDLLWQCAKGKGTLICLYESPTTPRTIVAIHLNDGSIGTLVDPNPEFRNIKLGEVERLEWKNEFGHSAFGHLLRPLNYTPNKVFPLVVVTYRSTGFLRGGTGDEYPEHVLAANDIAVLSLDIPNIFDYLSVGQDFDEIEKASARDLIEFRSMQSALESGIRLVQERMSIDPNRLAVTGLSTGSSIVFYALLHSPHRFAAAIASSPPPDPIAFYVMPETYRKKPTLGFGFPNARNGGFWNQLSPALHTTAFDTPLLMNIADSELIMSMQTVSAMTEHHKPFEAYVYPDEEHVKFWPTHRFAIYQRNVDWLNFWLKGEEDPSAAKAEQYKRWRELRKLQQENQKHTTAP